MKRPKNLITSLLHIIPSIIAFNGRHPVNSFSTDDEFLFAWRASQVKKNKLSTVEAYDLEFKKNKERFYKVTQKLRKNNKVIKNNNWKVV
jgi:hypothetical protein